jgi:hypothetical protein
VERRELPHLLWLDGVGCETIGVLGTGDGCGGRHGMWGGEGEVGGSLGTAAPPPPRTPHASCAAARERGACGGERRWRRREEMVRPSKGG